MTPCKWTKVQIATAAFPLSPLPDLTFISFNFFTSALVQVFILSLSATNLTQNTEEMLIFVKDFTL